MSVKSGGGKFRWQKNYECPLPSSIIVDMEGIHQDAESMAVTIINSVSKMLVVSGALTGRQDVMECIRHQAGMGARPYILADSAGTGQKASQSLGRQALVRYMSGFGAGVILADPGTKPGGAFICGGTGGGKVSVALSQRQVQDAYHALRWAFWERAVGEFVGGDIRKCKSLRVVTPPEGEWIKIQTSGHSRISDRVGEILRSKNITVLNPHWDDHSPLAAKICNIARGGTNVQVITQTNGSQVQPVLKKMILAGIRVLGFEHMNARAILADGSCLVVSGGLEEGGAEHGFHIGVELNSVQCRILQESINGWIANPQFRCEYMTGATKS